MLNVQARLNILPFLIRSLLPCMSLSLNKSPASNERMIISPQCVVCEDLRMPPFIAHTAVAEATRDAGTCPNNGSNNRW